MNLEQQIVDEILHICHKHKNINKVILFGSRAREIIYKKVILILLCIVKNSISEFIEDIEINISTLLEFDFSDMKDIQDEVFIEQVEKEGIIIYEKH